MSLLTLILATKAFATPNTFFQDFESFNNGKSWYLVDFGLDNKIKKKDFITEQGEIKFQLSWTRKTKKLMEDFGISGCEPKLEVGKASTYKSGSHSNYIAELDSDLGHCGVSRNEPASLQLKSFVPTKIGFVYRLSFKYKMRSYSKNDHRNLIARFGRNRLKLPVISGQFEKVGMEHLAVGKFAKVSFRDNGSPDSFGVLMDDIIVEEIGKSENYDACTEMFAVNSKGFRKCIKGEVELGQACEMDSKDGFWFNYKTKGKVANNRQNLENLYNPEGKKDGSLNFLSLGLGGRLAFGCQIGGYRAITPIFGKTLKLKEVTWGRQTYNSYPERAAIRVKLSGCHNKDLNGNRRIGFLKTNELIEFHFDFDGKGRSFEGCMLHKIIVKDRTPKGASGDGVDLNSFELN